MCAALGTLLVPAAGARAAPIALLSAIAPLQAPPPLGGSRPSATSFEVTFPGRIANRERVVVGLEADGSPASVTVTQRLVISRAGDFFFVVPAPAATVARASGSQAEPGLRDVGIVWQGFSSGRRVLAARAALDRSRAERALPLSIAVERVAGGYSVRLTDVARRPVAFVSGSASRTAAQAALARMREAERRAGDGPASVTLTVDGRPGPQVRTTVTAPLRVRGTITVPGRRPVAVAVTLGNGRPLVQTIAVRGRVSPRIALRVDLLSPLEILPTELSGSGNPLTELQRALARTALSWQFRRFLDSPDAFGPSTTTYAYRTIRQARVAAPPVPQHDGSDTLAIVLAATLGGAALLGLAVLWARS